MFFNPFFTSFFQFINSLPQGLFAVSGPYRTNTTFSFLTFLGIRRGARWIHCKALTTGPSSPIDDWNSELYDLGLQSVLNLIWNANAEGDSINWQRYFAALNSYWLSQNASTALYLVNLSSSMFAIKPTTVTSFTLPSQKALYKKSWMENDKRKLTAS